MSDDYRAMSPPPGAPPPFKARDPRDQLFCEIAIDLGFITAHHALTALEQQRVDDAMGQHKPVGAYLHAMQLISREQVAQIVKMQDRVDSARAQQQALVPAAPPGPVIRAPTASPTTRVSYILLGFFLGCFGVHNFVAGHTGKGVAQLVITFLLGWVFGLGLIISGIWALIDICSVTEDGQGRRLT